LKQNEMSFSLIIGEQNHIKYLIMMTDKTRNTFTKTMVDLVQDIVDYYTVTPLVSQGKAYPGTDQTKQGDKIELIFFEDHQLYSSCGRQFSSSGSQVCIARSPFKTSAKRKYCRTRSLYSE